MSNPASPQSSPADRNLLFGILALMNNFISQDTLIAATRAWLRDKARPLGQILLEEGKLTPKQYQLLEDLVQENLQVHDNDAHCSLMALARECFSELREELVGLSDPDVHASLAALGSSNGQDPYATRTESSVADPP